MIWKDFFYLLYPDLCLCCGKPLLRSEQLICLECLGHLPKTQTHLQRDNMVCKLFWGRSDIAFAASFLSFSKGGNVQHLIHLLKYKNKPEIGVLLGRMYGYYLMESIHFHDIDVIIPVPLHSSKQKKRGYNQSECIACGLSESMNKPVDKQSFVRIHFTETQTRKNRISRWENVQEVFTVVKNEAIENKHILLVDDVITTGATIEGCVQALQKDRNVKITVVSLATTQY